MSELLPSHLEMGNEIGQKDFFGAILNQNAHSFQGSGHVRQTESDGYLEMETDEFQQANQVLGRGIVSWGKETSLWGKNDHLFDEETCRDLGQIDLYQTCLDIFCLCRVQGNDHDICLCLDPSKAIALGLDHVEEMGNGMSIAFSWEMES